MILHLRWLTSSATIHKGRRQFFWIFDTHVGSFLVLSVGNFDQILTPPPSQLQTSFMDDPCQRQKEDNKIIEVKKPQDSKLNCYLLART